MPGILRRSALPFSLAALLALGACTDPATELARANIAGAGDECTAQTRGGAKCVFRNAPIRLQSKAVRLPGRPYTFYPMAQSLSFIDGGGSTWTAPTGTLTDGASIPEIFVPLIGSPRSREFANAAAVHDAYCGVGNDDGPVYHSQPWELTHRMFYDTLIAGGTPEIKAKIMFTAVWLRGPRWNPRSGKDDNRHLIVTDVQAVQMMQEAITYIEANNPPIPVLILYLDKLLAQKMALYLPQDRSSPVINSLDDGVGNQGGGFTGGQNLP